MYTHTHGDTHKRHNARHTQKQNKTQVDGKREKPRRTKKQGTRGSKNYQPTNVSGEGEVLDKPHLRCVSSHPLSAPRVSSLKRIMYADAIPGARKRAAKAKQFSAHVCASGSSLQGDGNKEAPMESRSLIRQHQASSLAGKPNTKGDEVTSLKDVLPVTLMGGDNQWKAVSGCTYRVSNAVWRHAFLLTRRVTGIVGKFKLNLSGTTDSDRCAPPREASSSRALMSFISFFLGGLLHHRSSISKEDATL